VLGNHCVYTLTKQEFLDAVEQPQSYHSFDAGPFHFVVLDACFTSDYPTNLTDRDSRDTKVRQLSLLAEAS
jgi:hypothetical protein